MLNRLTHQLKLQNKYNNLHHISEGPNRIGPFLSVQYARNQHSKDTHDAEPRAMVIGMLLCAVFVPSKGAIRYYSVHVDGSE